MILLSNVLLISCKQPTMEQDAQQAAEYSNISNQRASINDFSGAEKYYKDAQEIIDKYRNTNSFNDFFTLYNGYIEAQVYKKMEGRLLDEQTQDEIL